MQDGEHMFEESVESIKKYKIIELTSRKSKISERHVPTQEKPKKRSPTRAPQRGRIEIIEIAVKRKPQTQQITDDLKVANPQSLGYLIKNLQIEEEDRLLEMMTSNESVTIVSNRGLKAQGGFCCMAARANEIMATCHGNVKGSINQTSSYRTESTGMFSAIYAMNGIMDQLRAEMKFSIWTDNAIVTKMIEYDPMAKKL